MGRSRGTISREPGKPVTLSMLRKTKEGLLPVGYDDVLKAYLVLPATYLEYFESRSEKTSLPGLPAGARTLLATPSGWSITPSSTKPATDASSAVRRSLSLRWVETA